MKKTSFLIVVCVMFMSNVFAGGLLTNSNQSAQYIRTLSRNASTGIDAVFYNPAGLIKIDDGWHFGFYNQTIFQNKIVDSEFPLLNDGHYEGDITVPVFPSLFGVYKKENWAFSLGIGPNSGGGIAKFDRGLASFEIPITKLGSGFKKISSLLTPYQIPAAVNTGYDANLSFEGRSVFLGFQAGASYKLSDLFSVSAGFRILSAKNSYSGEINNINIETSSGLIPADQYFSLASPVLEGTINSLQTASNGLLGAINAGLIDPNDNVADPQLVLTLSSLGYDNVTNGQAIVIMDGTKESIENLKNADISDKEVDTEQTGTGITPMIGVHISPSDKLDIALKYEMKTSLTLTNDTKVDDLNLYPDGGKTINDIPAIMGLGIGYKAADWLEAMVSYTLYVDKGVDWGRNVRDVAIWKGVDDTKIRQREIDKNYFELALGLQFNLSEKFAISVGGMRSRAGIADTYQSDFSFSNPSYTGAFGFMWKMSDRLTLDAGFSNTFYKDEEVTFTDPDVGDYNDVYGKTTTNIAVGIAYSIF